MTERLSDLSLAQLSEFIADRMGFHFPRERWLDLERGMRSASRACGFEDVESCVQWLVSSPVTRAQIEVLAGHLSIGETYFFRERQTFDALEARVLLELINRRRATDRRLRIWSAGCCTGEEPYSIAILLKRMLPDLEDWQITVLATDINPDFLNRAADGIYGEWSFRGVPAGIREKYFTKTTNGRFEIIPKIKKMVSFSYLNLMEDCYPSLLNNTYAMDLVFCRNVLMYFDPVRAKQVVRKLHHSLTDGGWLVVSPCEASHVVFQEFATVSFPGSILYRKDTAPIFTGSPCTIEAPTHSFAEPVRSLSFKATAARDIPGVEPPEKSTSTDTPANGPESEQDFYGECMLRYERGFYEEAAQMLSRRLTQDQSDAKAAALLTRVYANQGKLAEASRCSELAVAADRLNPSCHMLQATIFQEQGAIPEATRALERALYLEPNLVLAHFALGNLARRQDKVREAARHFNNARALLGVYDPDEVLPEFDGMTAGRLMEIIRSTHGDRLSAATGERSISSSASVPDRSLRKGIKEEQR